VLSREDEWREEKALVWAVPSGHVNPQILGVIRIVASLSLREEWYGEFKSENENIYILQLIEVCKSDPKPIRIRSDSFGFRNQNIHFGSDW
jgi:hypothetical protein